MKAINKILLLTDFSELANNATQYALNIAKRGNAGDSIPPSPGQSEHSWPVKVSHPRRMKVSHFWT